MHAALFDYFAGQKHLALVLILLGLVAIALAAYLWYKRSAYKSLGYPFAVIALVQLFVGGTVHTRTDAQVSQLETLMISAPVDFRGAELDRMKGVSERFRLFKITEGTLVLTGILLTFFYRGNVTGLFIGVGLILDAGLMLVLNLFAEYRAQIYISRLLEFIPIMS